MNKPYDVSIEVAYPKGEGSEDKAARWIQACGWWLPPFSGTRTEPNHAIMAYSEDFDEPTELEVYVFSPISIIDADIPEQRTEGSGASTPPDA